MIRHKTKLEKEQENMPDCILDPLQVSKCYAHDFPPTEKYCRDCMIGDIAIALRHEDNSEAMRWFIAFLTIERRKKK